MPAHSHNLSINSIGSLIEPTTPPSLLQNSQPFQHKRSHLNLWDHPPAPMLTNYNQIHKSADITLPSFVAPDQSLSPLHANNTVVKSATAGFGRAPGRNLSVADKENSAGWGLSLSASHRLHFATSEKLDKEYLASLAKVPLDKLKPEILRLAKDQYGCRYLQKKIDEHVIASPVTRQENFEIIFQEVYPYFYELIIDPFGNYLIQKLIGYCSEQQMNLVLEILQFNLFQISINQHGTRALQKIIDSLTNAYQLGLLVDGLQPYIIGLIKDLNGNHVIQKILNKFPPQSCQFVYDSILQLIIVVATHKHGCCVLQKCLNHVTSAQLALFAAEILKFDNFCQLINDQFGNYVLQYLISLNIVLVNYQVFDEFVNFGITNLCNLKFSSNVIEKFLKNCYANEAAAAATATAATAATAEFAAKKMSFSQPPQLQPQQPQRLQHQLEEQIFGATALSGSTAGNLVNASGRVGGYKIEAPLGAAAAAAADALNLTLLLDDLAIAPKVASFTDLKYDLIYQILSSNLNKLINDQYGNYVIQTLIDVLQSESRSEKLRLLLPFDSGEPIQIQVIRKWFANCKIVSSFGKRIQLKINTIINNSTAPAFPHRTYVHDERHFNPASVHTNMNANGEFVTSMHQRLAQPPAMRATYQPNYTFAQSQAPPQQAPPQQAPPPQFALPLYQAPPHFASQYSPVTPRYDARRSLNDCIVQSTNMYSGTLPYQGP
jgi:hypothetical protein